MSDKANTPDTASGGRREPKEYGAMAVMSRKLEGENRTIRFIGTSAMRDRYNSEITLQGWDFKWFKKNPVVLWSHNHDLPGVGLAERLTKETIDGVEGWVFDIDFNEAVEDYRLPEVLFQYATKRRIRATSVGFLSHASKWIDPDTDEAKAWKEDNPDLYLDKVYKKKELLELSLCNVGANPEALQAIHQNAYGRGSSSLREHLAWIERAMGANERTGVIYVPMQLAMGQGQTSNECRWPFKDTRCEYEDEENPETDEDDTEVEPDTDVIESAAKSDAASNAAGSAVPAEARGSAQEPPVPAAPPAREPSETAKDDAVIEITGRTVQRFITITG
jgi:hypothetical protein